MLMIINPGFEAIEPRLFLVLGASVLLATYLLMTRHLAGREDAASTQFNTTAVGAVLLSALVIPGWEPIPLSTLAMLAVFGAAGAVGHFALVRGFAYAPASMLSPFLYVQVLAAAVFSLMFFGDPLRPTMIVGTAILIASGIYIWWREQRRSPPLA